MSLCYDGFDQDLSVRSLRRGTALLRDGGLLQVLRSEINHELSSSCESSCGDGVGSEVEGFMLEWTEVRTQDVVLRRQPDHIFCEEIAVSALLAPLQFQDKDPLPRDVLMKVCIKKAGYDSVLRFDCRAFCCDKDQLLPWTTMETNDGGIGSDFTIRKAYCSSSVDYLGKCKSVGPIFSSLDPQLQKALKDYLVVRGITPKLTNFLLEHLHRKEHSQYVNWLRTMEGIVANISPPNPGSTYVSTGRSASLATRTNIFFSSAAKSKPIDHVLKLFHLLPARDTVTWNTAISACLRHCRVDAALRLFVDMLLASSPAPDAITIRLVLRAFSEANYSRLLPQIHAYVLKLQEQLPPSELTVLHTCLLNSYRKFGYVELAHKVFCGMPDQDVVTFTSMLTGYVQDGRHVEALRIFQGMVESGRFRLNEHVYSCALRACAGNSTLYDAQQIHAHVLKSGMASDVFTGTSLVDLYVKCDEMECARRAFLGISEPSVVSWNALMAGKLDGDEEIMLFGHMRSLGLVPDHMTFANVLRACRDGVGTEEVRQLHGIFMKMMEVKLDTFVSIALFEAYIDHGCFNEAQNVFSVMVQKDDVAYNLAIQGYNRNGHATEAVSLFLECLKMGKELRERDLALWTSLISGFSRIGESEAALKLYVRMVTEASVEPPNHYMFSAVLSSCAQIAALEEGKQIHAQHCSFVDPTSRFILLLISAMGNGLSPCCLTGSKGLVRLVFWGGATELLTGKQLAAELMFRFPDRVVCRADSFYIGRPLPVLSMDDELLPGHTYFLLPMDKFPCHDPLTAVSLASLSPDPAKAVSLSGDNQCRPFAYVKGGDGRVLIKVLPEFITKVISSAESGDTCGSGCGALCSTPELKKHYAQLVGQRDRPWSPKLETISESKKRSSVGRISPVSILLSCKA
ncbi:Saccharopine dehydrogenase, partial [Musa troglodytarum]